MDNKQRNEDLNVALSGIALLAMMFLALMVLAVAFGGCATNRVYFSEKLYDGTTGFPTSDTTFSQTAFTTAFATQEEGTGTMDYQGDNWRLAIGNSAKAQAGGDPTQAAIALGNLIGGVITSSAQSAAVAAANRAPKVDWTAMLQAAIKVLGTMQQQPAAAP